MRKLCGQPLGDIRPALKRRVTGIIEGGKNLRLRDDIRVKAHRDERLKILDIGIDDAPKLQKCADYKLGALHAVHALYIGFQRFFFHRLRSFLPFVSFSELNNTPIELSDMEVAQIDGCSTPAAAMGMLRALYTSAQRRF